MTSTSISVKKCEGGYYISYWTDEDIDKEVVVTSFPKLLKVVQQIFMEKFNAD